MHYKKANELTQKRLINSHIPSRKSNKNKKIWQNSDSWLYLYKHNWRDIKIIENQSPELGAEALISIIDDKDYLARSLKSLIKRERKESCSHQETI